MRSRIQAGDVFVSEYDTGGVVYVILETRGRRPFVHVSTSSKNYVSPISSNEWLEREAWTDRGYRLV